MHREMTNKPLTTALIAAFLTAMPATADAACETDTARSRQAAWSFSLSGGSAHLLKSTEENSAQVDGRVGAHYGINATWQAPHNPSHLSDRAFGYPAVDIGLTVTDFSATRFSHPKKPRPYRSRLGREYTLYGAFRRDIVRTARQSFGYTLENGLGIASSPYERQHNADNLLIGSRFSFYLAGSLYYMHRLTPHISLGAELSVRHYSNGVLDRPNTGENSIVPGIRLTWSPEAVRETVRDTTDMPPFERKVYTEIAVGWEGHTILDEWLYNYWTLRPGDKNYESGHYRLYSSPTLMLAGMWRWERRYATGIALDYQYSTFSKATRRAEESRGHYGYNYSAHTVGLSLRHEVFWRDVSAQMSIGSYLFRQAGYQAEKKETSFYETLGLRYYPPFARGKLFVGYNVKVHLFKVEGIQLSAGFRFL